MSSLGEANPNYKGYMHRKCKQCGGPINGSSATRKFCSRVCQAASYRTPENYRVCPRCGKDFYHRSNQHCSAVCARALKSERAVNPGRRQRLQERKLAEGPELKLGRPLAVKQPRVCPVCAKGFLVRPSENDRVYCSRECYGKSVGLRQQGANHPGYKHGRAALNTSERQRLRRHADYKRWRDAVFARDDFTCRSCRTKGSALTAHHHAAWAEDVKARLKVSNGITLCDECHRLWHAYNRKGLFEGKEALLQAKVIEALREYGFYVFNVPGNPMGTTGIADLLVCFNGVFGALECKVFPNYLSELQRVNGERVAAAGGVFYVVQSEDDVGRVIELFETRVAKHGAWVDSEAAIQTIKESTC